MGILAKDLLVQEQIHRKFGHLPSVKRFEEDLDVSKIEDDYKGILKLSDQLSKASKALAEAYQRTVKNGELVDVKLLKSLMNAVDAYLVRIVLLNNGSGPMTAKLLHMKSAAQAEYDKLNHDAEVKFEKARQDIEEKHNKDLALLKVSYEEQRAEHEALRLRELNSLAQTKQIAVEVAERMYDYMTFVYNESTKELSIGKELRAKVAEGISKGGNFMVGAESQYKVLFNAEQFKKAENQ